MYTTYSKATIKLRKSDLFYQNYSSVKEIFTEELNWDPTVYQSSITLKIQNCTDIEEETLFKSWVGRKYLDILLQNHPTILYYINPNQLDILLNSFMDFDEKSEQTLHTMQPRLKVYLTQSLEEFIENNSIPFEKILPIYMKIISVKNTILKD